MGQTTHKNLEKRKGKLPEMLFISTVRKDSRRWLINIWRGRYKLCSETEKWVIKHSSVALDNILYSQTWADKGLRLPYLLLWKIAWQPLILGTWNAEIQGLNTTEVAEKLKKGERLKGITDVACFIDFARAGEKITSDGDTVPLKGPWQEKRAFKRKLRFGHADILSFKNSYSDHRAFLEQ